MQKMDRVEEHLMLGIVSSVLLLVSVLYIIIRGARNNLQNLGTSRYTQQGWQINISLSICSMIFGIFSIISMALMSYAFYLHKAYVQMNQSKENTFITQNEVHLFLDNTTYHSLSKSLPCLLLIHNILFLKEASLLDMTFLTSFTAFAIYAIYRQQQLYAS
jgi:hypothetical protein